MRESSCSPSPAPQPLLYTTFHMTSLAASCITSIQITRRFVHGSFPKFCFGGLVCPGWKLCKVLLLFYKRVTRKLDSCCKSQGCKKEKNLHRSRGVVEIQSDFWSFSWPRILGVTSWRTTSHAFLSNFAPEYFYIISESLDCVKRSFTVWELQQLTWFCRVPLSSVLLTVWLSWQYSSVFRQA